MKGKRVAVKAHLWSERIAAFERSGLSRRAWCEQEGLSQSTLDYWRSRLRDRTASRALVPIVVAGHEGSAASIEIALVNGTRVRAPSGVDATWLSTLVRGIC